MALTLNEKWFSSEETIFWKPLTRFIWANPIFLCGKKNYVDRLTKFLCLHAAEN